jgi:hypothetical protein
MEARGRVEVWNEVGHLLEHEEGQEDGEGEEVEEQWEDW